MEPTGYWTEDLTRHYGQLVDNALRLKIKPP